MSIKANSWKVLIVDDEALIHDNLEINLRDIQYDNKKIELLHSFSAFQAKEVIRNDDKIAVIILDVMMEQDSSGLDFINFVRNEMQNHDVRILLHTGQPGIAPKKEVTDDYLIDAYLDKNVTDNDDSYAAVKMAIRAYKQRLDIKNSSVKTDVELLQEIANHYVYLLRNWNILKKQQEIMSKINSMMIISQEILAAYALQDLKENLTLGTTKLQRLSFEDYSSLIQIHNLKIILTQISNERFKKEKVIIFDNISDAAGNFSLIKILPESSKKEIEKYLNNK